MSVTASVQKTISMGGVTFNQSLTPTADAMVVQSVTVPVALAGVLSTRTDANTGVVDVSDSGHSFAQSDRVDLYWTGGSRRGMSVSTVSGSLITIDGGAGDDLPAEDAIVNITEPKLLDIAVTGNDVKAIFLHSSLLGMVTMVSSAVAELLNKTLGVNAVWDYEENTGADNPLADVSVAAVYLSNSSTTTAATMKVGILFNN